jgi:chromosome partitioning protein
MRTIAFVSQKDGAGKSTIASSLAVAAREMKEAVAVVDMDPQGSLTNWARTRGSGDIEVVASGAARLPATLAELAAKGCTLAIVDTPGAEGPASPAAMAAADLTIIASRPSLFDLKASANARAALLETGGDFVFLLNQCPPGRPSARVRDGVERLREMGRDRPAHCVARGLPGGGSPGLGRHRARFGRGGGQGDAATVVLDSPSASPPPGKIRRA